MAALIKAKQISIATAVDVGIANAEGSSGSVARADHVHKMGADAKQSVMESKRFAFGTQALNFSANGASATGAAITQKILDLTLSKKTGGSASVSALVVAAPENKVEIRDHVTNEPVHGVYTDVYGRTTATPTVLAGVYVWDGTTTVLTGDTSDVVVGDFIKLNSDGQLFRVLSKVTDTSVLIDNTAALVIPTGTGAGGTSKVALTLTYYEENASSAEIGYTFGSAEAIDFIFQESMDLYTAPFGALQSGMAFSEPLPLAHTHTLAQGATDVTATATEINDALDGISANVTDTNLNTLTGGGDVGALHTHAAAYSAIGHNHDSVYIAKALLTAKGSLISASASATPVELGIGSNGQFLKVNTGTASGLEWASPASSDVERQEVVTTEAVSGADVALADQLANTPKNNASVSLFLNGIQQEQGATKDYTIAGKVITWLASSGTAVDMETTDSLIAYYVS